MDGWRWFLFVVALLGASVNGWWLDPQPPIGYEPPVVSQDDQAPNDPDASISGDTMPVPKSQEDPACAVWPCIVGGE